MSEIELIDSHCHLIFENFEKDIDLKQRAWIEVKGKAIETNVRQLR